MTVIYKIEVTSDKALIKGGKVQLMETISKTKVGISSDVPTFVSIWRWIENYKILPCSLLYGLANAIQNCSRQFCEPF